MLVRFVLYCGGSVVNCIVSVGLWVGAGSALQTLALVQSPALGSSRQPAAAGGAGAGKVKIFFLFFAKKSGNFPQVFLIKAICREWDGGWKIEMYRISRIF